MFESNNSLNFVILICNLFFIDYIDNQYQIYNKDKNRAKTIVKIYKYQSDFNQLMFD
jgi:hypothetical protein